MTVLKVAVVKRENAI